MATTHLVVVYALPQHFSACKKSSLKRLDSSGCRPRLELKVALLSSEKKVFEDLELAANNTLLRGRLKLDCKELAIALAL
jgi:hypothetical protein